MVLNPAPFTPLIPSLESPAKHLAKQKIPRSIDFISELPRSQAGKVQRKKLRDSYWPTQ